MPAVQYRKTAKEDLTMEAITFICTLCGAAALSRGIVQLIDHLGR